MKGATLVVVAGKAACGAPGGLAHGRDVAEAMGRGGGGRRLVGASSLAWPGRQASPATYAGGLCRGTEQGRVRERERERREERERRGRGGLTGGPHSYVASTSAKPHSKPPGWPNMTGFESWMVKATRFWSWMAKIKLGQELDGQKWTLLL